MAPCERFLRTALAIVFWYSLGKRFHLDGRGRRWTVTDVRALG
jgi:hypothetical protein